MSGSCVVSGNPTSIVAILGLAHGKPISLGVRAVFDEEYDLSLAQVWPQVFSDVDHAVSEDFVGRQRTHVVNTACPHRRKWLWAAEIVWLLPDLHETAIVLCCWQADRG